MVQPSSFEEEIKSYKNKQNACVKLIEIVSNLWFNDSIELVLFRNQLVDRRVSLILNLHKKQAIFQILNSILRKPSKLHRQSNSWKSHRPALILEH